MTLQERINVAANGSGVFVIGDGSYEAQVVIPVDCRIYGDGSPWWGSARIEHVEVRQARVTLEALTVLGLWWRNGYLGTITNVLCQTGGLMITPDPSDTPSLWPSAVTMTGVHVRGGPLMIAAANISWHGGSVERTTGALEIGTGSDDGAVVVVGVRFEHDALRKLVIHGRSPITMIGCHFTLTDVEFASDAHKDSKLIGCSRVGCRINDHRSRWSW